MPAPTSPHVRLQQALLSLASRVEGLMQQEVEVYSMQVVRERETTTAKRHTDKAGHSEVMQENKGAGA